MRDSVNRRISTYKNYYQLLTGPVEDQAALHGLLKKVRDLGMPLISVAPVEPDRRRESMK